MERHYVSLYGIVTSVAKINKRVSELTGDPTPILDTNADWRRFVRYKDNRTYIFIDPPPAIGR